MTLWLSFCYSCLIYRQVYVTVYRFQQVTEFYSRDPSIPADDDIAELTFLLNEEKIFIKHHLQVRELYSLSCISSKI